MCDHVNTLLGFSQGLGVGVGDQCKPGALPGPFPALAMLASFERNHHLSPFSRLHPCHWPSLSHLEGFLAHVPQVSAQTPRVRPSI